MDLDTADGVAVDKAWSEEAREAALEARRAQAQGKPEPTGTRTGAATATSSGLPAGVQEYTPSDKVMRAQAAYVSANSEEQKMADEQERIVSTALGMPRTPDNKEFDLLSGHVGIELKTMVKQKNDKVTMSKSALARKTESIASRGSEFRAYTVVADKRGGATRYYVREGVGSFRLGTMTQVSLQELRNIVRRPSSYL